MRRSIRISISPVGGSWVAREDIPPSPRYMLASSVYVCCTLLLPSYGRELGWEANIVLLKFTAKNDTLVIRRRLCYNTKMVGSD